MIKSTNDKGLELYLTVKHYITRRYEDETPHPNFRTVSKPEPQKVGHHKPNEKLSAKHKLIILVRLISASGFCNRNDTKYRCKIYFSS